MKKKTIGMKVLPCLVEQNTGGSLGRGNKNNPLIEGVAGNGCFQPLCKKCINLRWRWSVIQVIHHTIIKKCHKNTTMHILKQEYFNVKGNCGCLVG